MTATFKGGFHVDGNKRLTEHLHTVTLPGCEMHIFPLRQHIGAPLTPIVKEGDYVCMGQKLADSEQPVSAPVHSSVSGKVTEIKPHIHDSGTMVESVFIENDGKYKLFDGIRPSNYTSMSREDMLKVIRNAGIVGMGGAGFPTHIKLNPSSRVDHIIVNCAECEPYITSDHRYMLEEPDKVLYGLKAAMRILGLNEGYIGAEVNKKDGIRAIEESSEYNERIHIIQLKEKYPQGAEKQLIKAITGRHVPMLKLPADAGCVVINCATACAIAEAFMSGMPAITKNVTVTGDAVKNPSNFKTRIGVPVSFLIEQAGGFSKPPKKLISGGPMMGITQYTTDYPVTKTTSSVLALANPQKTYDEDAPCIKCGRCVAHCPMKLMPYKLAEFSRKGDTESAGKYNILECMECGLCSYICPANKNLLQFIRMIKPEVMRKKREEKNG